MGQEFSFITDATVGNLLRNATAKWIVSSLDASMLEYILRKYEVSTVENPLEAIIAIRKKLGILPPLCEYKLLSEITVCDNLYVKLEKIDDTRLLLCVIYDGIKYTLVELEPIEIGWEDYSMRSIGSGDTKSGTANVSLIIKGKPDNPASMEVCFKFYREGNKEIFHVGSWSDTVTEHYVFDPSSEDFAICAVEDTVLEDTRKVLESLELFDVISMKLLKESHKELCLQVFLNNNIVLETKFSQNYLGCDKYLIEDIQSGMSSTGDYYLSIAVSVDDLSAMPEAREIAIIVNKDGKAEVVGINSWSDSEIGSYLVFDEDHDKFITFSNIV